MAIGALAAVVHDLIITVGVYALFQFEVTPATVIAILTILGYSLYDTIVVYDKVKDNADNPAIAQKMPYTEMMSLSLNQVLMRSLNTTITSLLPVLAMLLVGSFILGAVTLQEFAVALTVGLVCGAYSSIFVATPLVAYLKEREPHYRALRARLATQEARRSGSTDAVTATQTAVATSSSAGSPGTSVAQAPELSGRVIPPRPRKKGKRR
jgi:preprotein translocase subunit SecF